MIDTPQLSLRAVLLSLLLTVALAAANAYLGLKVGLTVATAIPAAVVSMGVLRLLGRSSILENNIVATGASAGSSIAAGSVFTMPALVILGFWSRFEYWWVFAIIGLGGLLPAERLDPGGLRNLQPAYRDGAAILGVQRFLTRRILVGLDAVGTCRPQRGARCFHRRHGGID